MSERGTVVLVEEDGTVTGSAPKLEAHRSPGLLHLAFSVFLYRQDGSMLLQRRSPAKYHFPGVWANACCSHPGPGEDLVSSAERRVVEELGLVCALSPAGSFVYRAPCAESGLVEHELDHVLIGTILAEPVPDNSEVAALWWGSPETVLRATSVPAPAGLTARTARSGLPAGPLAPWLGPALRLAEAARHRLGLVRGDLGPGPAERAG
ncbi:MAG: idi, partial [Acidimicrobiaceae bacterium]|nr:idi [Acidimicrobiaceae bacterium]